MKLSLSLFYGLFAVVFLLPNIKVQAGEPIHVTGFLVDAAVVNNIMNSGADGVKIFAATDDGGNMYYILAGTDASFNVLPGQAYRQNYKGDCPPSCEFAPSGLAGGGSYVDGGTADALVKNYMNSRAGMANCVMINKATIDKLKSFPYLKVNFASAVTITGIKSDGTTGKGGTVTDAANASCACEM